jgi:dihydroorotate dehydrogenase electron transfer subunit
MPAKKAFSLKAKLISNQRINGDNWHALLRAPAVAANAVPGQFVQVRVSAGIDPLLRRPFSIHSVRGQDISIMYEVIGAGTRIFSEKKAGEDLEVIGPLGNGFDISFTRRKGVRAAEVSILVAGGMGVAPLVFLAQKLSAVNSKLETIALVGGRSKEDVLCLDEFRKAGCAVKVSTDDGSSGARGRVTSLLENALRKIDDAERAKVFACGPKPMLKGVDTVVKKFGITAQLSLESHMSCGIGACLGCVVDTTEGYKRVCKEGPVFNARELTWGEGI